MTSRHARLVRQAVGIVALVTLSWVVAWSLARDAPMAVGPRAAAAADVPPAVRGPALAANGFDETINRLGFRCAMIVDRYFGFSGADKAQLAVQATAAGGPSRFLLPDQPAWAPDQMWIGDAAGAVQGYSAELVSSEPDEAWLIGVREGETIGFELRRLEVAPGLSLWHVVDMILPYSPCTKASWSKPPRAAASVAQGPAQASR